MYNSTYINDFDEKDYKKYLNNASKLRELMNEYLNQHNGQSDSLYLAFKESLDHYILKQIIKSNGDYINSIEFYNYITYIMQISKNKLSTLNGIDYNMELTSNIIYRIPEIRTKILKKYYNDEAITIFEGQIKETKRQITKIYKKMKNREQISQEELDFICDYIYSSRDFSNDIGKTCAEYIFNEINHSSNIKASSKIVGAITSYFTQCYTKDKEVKNSRVFIAETDRGTKDLAHKSGRKRYCHLDKEYFTKISLLDDESLNKGRTYGKDLYYLMMVTFHELTHEHQHIERLKNKNSSSAMAYIVKDILNRNLKGTVKFDHAGNPITKTEYMINHDSTEYEIQADEESWKECQRFIAEHCRHYAYKHNLSTKKITDCETKCYNNQQEIRARRAFSLKLSSDGSPLYYALYDIKNLASIIKSNPKIINDYPVLKLYFTPNGELDTSVLFTSNITSKDESGLDLDNTGLEFATYMLDNNKDKILERVSSGNLTKNQIRTLVTNIYNIMHQNVLKIRDFDRVDKSNYDKTSHNYDLGTKSDNVYNYYFTKTAQEIYIAMEILYKIHECYPKIDVSEYNDTKYYISYFYELVSKVPTIKPATIQGICDKYDSSQSPILFELSMYMKENMLGNPKTTKSQDDHPSGSIKK